MNKNRTNVIDNINTNVSNMKRAICQHGEINKIEVLNESFTKSLNRNMEEKSKIEI